MTRIRRTLSLVGLAALFGTSAAMAYFVATGQGMGTFVAPAFGSGPTVFNCPTSSTPIDSASATTLSPGSSATAAYDPTPCSLTLGIPTGATGATGAPGANGTNGTNGVSVTSTSLASATGPCANSVGGVYGSSFASANGTTYACTGAQGPAGQNGTNGTNGSAAFAGFTHTPIGTGNLFCTPVGVGDVTNGGCATTSGVGAFVPSNGVSLTSFRCALSGGTSAGNTTFTLEQAVPAVSPSFVAVATCTVPAGTVSGLSTGTWTITAGNWVTLLMTAGAASKTGAWALS